MAYYRKIPGDRLFLSPMCPDDAPLYIKWVSDPLVAATLGTIHEGFSERSERKFLEKCADDVNAHDYAIVLNEGERLIGNTSLMDIDAVYRRARIGLFIGEAADRGKGYGAEALRLLLAYGFNQLNLRNIMLDCHADNAAGLACYRKVGFTEIGRRREAVFRDGRYIDLVYMDMLADEFRAVIR